MSIRDSYEYRMAMDIARERDGHVCQVCGNPYDQVHHVVPVRVAPYLACDPENLVCLCEECHEVADADNDRKYGCGRRGRR